MGNYSSDSETEKRGSKISTKSRNRRRSSSTDSSDNIGKRRKDKRSGRKSKSRSRERYSKSRRSRSSSGSTYQSSKSKTSTSISKDRSRYKSHKRSKSRSRGAYKSRRSRSKSYIKEYVSKQKKCTSSSSSSDEQSRKDVRAKSTLESEKIKIKNSPDCHEVPIEVLDEINEDKFVQRSFSSNKSKKVLENIVIDLKKNTIKVPEVEPIEPDSIFHHNLFLNDEARVEKWVKELYSYRQKALQQGLKHITKA